MTETPTIRYLNTDLDLAAPVPLQPLFSELEGRGFYGWIEDADGRGLAMVEVETECEPIEQRLSG